MRGNQVPTLVIPWSDLRIDDQPGPPVGELRAGGTWLWAGAGQPAGMTGRRLVLQDALGASDLHAAAARSVARFVSELGPAGTLWSEAELAMGDMLILTDGSTTYEGAVIFGPDDPSVPLYLAFRGSEPPRGRELWIARWEGCARSAARRRRGTGAGAGVVCFTPGTLILTPSGYRPVEELREGDAVQTKDNGARPLRWKGGRHVSGARLYTDPLLRPLRIRTSALGLDLPKPEIRLSRDHSVLLSGKAAEALYGSAEVLVRAQDLLGMEGVSTDVSCRSVDYIHLMFESHEILFANGLESESFHPAMADLSHLAPSDLLRLEEALGLDLSQDATPLIERSFGMPARRQLSGAEAAIYLADRGARRAC